MPKFLVEVVSSKEEEYTMPYSHISSTQVVLLREANIYEAISKYLAVKGFTTEVVSVTEYGEGAVNEDQAEGV